MTFVITNPCIDTKDQSCVEVCPVDCIHFDGDADRILYINPAECIDCGACQPACPVSAIFAEADVPAELRAFTAVNELWYSDPAAARAQVEALAGAGGGAPAAAPAAATPTAPAPSTTSTAASGEAAAAASEAVPAAGPVSVTFAVDPAGPKHGENGLEGKCALCGQYVTKGGVLFRAKSVLCPECAKRQERIGNPYQRTAGRR